jgi:3'-5' exoribonuclease
MNRFPGSDSSPVLEPRSVFVSLAQQGSAAMPRVFVNQLADGSPVDEVFLLADRQLRANRHAETYLLAQLRDKTGQVSGLLWNVSENTVAQLQVGDFVKVKGKIQLFQGNLQLIMNRIEKAPSEGLNQADFVQETSVNAARLLTRLKEILLSIDDAPLRTLMECFLDDEKFMARLAQAPAGIRLHHAYAGGLLEHIVNLLETITRIADLYPKVDSRLLLAGAFLHDIGKVRELEFDAVFGYTDEGQLIGHLVQGVEMVNEHIPEVERRLGYAFPKETLLRVKHMLLSHHGTYEFGSPKLPMTPEAIALHHLDNLDAKVNEYATLITSDPNSQSTWTPYQATMQRKIFKGGG